MKKLYFTLLVLFMVGFVQLTLAQIAGFNITGNSSRCVNTNFSFNNTSTGATSYNWEFGDGNTSMIASPTHAYSSSGIYVVKLTAINGGNSTTAVKAIYVNPVPYANFYQDGYNFSQGMPVRFKNSSKDAVGYLWSFGDGSISTAVNPRKVFANPGDYTVTLKAFNGCFDTVTTSNLVTIRDTANIKPSASGYMNPNITCPGTKVSFSNYSSDLTNALWIFGDGQTLQTLKNEISHTYATKGTYYPMLVAFLGNRTDTMKFTLNVTDTAMVMPGSNVNPYRNIGGTFRYATCAGSPFYLSSYGGTDAYFRRWKLPDGTFLPGDRDTTISWSTTGKRTIWYVASNGCGAKDSVAYDLYVLRSDTFLNTLSPFSVSPYTGMVCPGDKFNFYLYASESEYTLRWVINGTEAGSSNELTYTTTSTPGPVNVKVYITPVCGVIDSMTRTLYTQTDVIPNADFSSSFNVSEHHCMGDTAYFTGFDYSNPNAVNHLWDFGDGTTSTLENPTHKFNTQGWVTVLHRVNNHCGNVKYNARAFYLTSNLPPVPRFDVYEDAVCAGDSVMVNNYTFDADSAVIDFGDGQFKTYGYGFFPHNFHTYALPGVYFPKLYVFNRCTVDSAQEVLKVLPKPVMNIVNADSSVVVNTNVTFSKSASGLVSFYWSLSPNGENPVTTETYQVLFNQVGRKVVYLFGENANGCRNRDSAVITVMDPIGLLEPNGKVESLQWYPNPFNDQLSMRLQLRSAARVRSGLYALDGRMIQSLGNEIASGTVEVSYNIPSLPAGIYLLLTEVDGRVFTRKMVKF